MGSRKRVKQRRVHRRNLDDWSFIAIPLVMPSNFAKLNIRTPSVVHEVDKLPDAGISFRTRANLLGKRKFGEGRKTGKVRVEMQPRSIGGVSANSN